MLGSKVFLNHPIIPSRNSLMIRNYRYWDKQLEGIQNCSYWTISWCAFNSSGTTKSKIMKIYMYICIFFFFPKIVCATLIRNRFDRADYFSIFKNTIFLYFSLAKREKRKDDSKVLFTAWFTQRKNLIIVIFIRLFTFSPR